MEINQERSTCGTSFSGQMIHLRKMNTISKSQANGKHVRSLKTNGVTMVDYRQKGYQNDKVQIWELS